MMEQRVTRTASFSLFFLLSGFALVHAQAPPPEPTEPPSRLTMFAHDVSSWVDHIITGANHISTGADHHRVSRSPPLPRPRPAELASAPVASKEKTPTPVQIND